MADTLVAGAAVADITPLDSQHLFGYPHVQRNSVGVHDPLLSSALYLSDGAQQAIFIANDTIFIGKPTARRVRARIAAQTGVPAENILISATHTHSAPLALDYTRREVELDAPEPDLAYLRLMEDGIVAAAVEACRRRAPAEAALVVADAAGIGTNRHDPAGPANLDVPVLAIRQRADKRYLALMLICCMHPTVLHEDSLLVSGDFPAMARQYLQRNLLGLECPVLHHTGPAGNQSPRHVTTANTFDEATRLGEILGRAVERALHQASFAGRLPIDCRSVQIGLPRRRPCDPAAARSRLDHSRRRFNELRAAGAPKTEVRTAECDLFGAEEACALAEASAAGRLESAYANILPAEVQLICVGPWAFLAWPCETFVEFGLELQARVPNAFVISLANGELRGYIVTQQAIDENWYEAGNSLMKSPDTGEQLVAASIALLTGSGVGKQAASCTAQS